MRARPPDPEPRLALPKLQSRAAPDRAGGDPLVCARLCGGHPARLALCGRAGEEPAHLARRAADRRREAGGRLRPVGRARRGRRRTARLDPLLRHSRDLDRPAGDPQALARRHELPRRADRRGHRDPAVRARQPAERASPGRPDRAVRADRALLRADRQLHQRRAVGTADARALGHGVLQRAAACAGRLPGRPAAPPPKPALRGGAGGDRAGSASCAGLRTAPSCCPAAG